MHQNQKKLIFIDSSFILETISTEELEKASNYENPDNYTVKLFFPSLNVNNNSLEPEDIVPNIFVIFGLNNPKLKNYINLFVFKDLSFYNSTNEQKKQSIKNILKSLSNSLNIEYFYFK